MSPRFFYAPPEIIGLSNFDGNFWVECFVDTAGNPTVYTLFLFQQLKSFSDGVENSTQPPKKQAKNTKSITENSRTKVVRKTLTLSQ